MAYTLESLKQIIDQVLLCWILDEKPQIESLLEKVTLLKDFLENSLPFSSKRTEALEIQIRDATIKAEDIIESHIADQFLTKSHVDRNENHRIFSSNLKELIEEFESIKEELIKIVDKTQIQNPQTKSTLPVVSSKPDSSTNYTMVGYEEDINQLKDRLTGQKSTLQIIPIVGMGGIGKTTLAQNLYDDQYIVYHFDTRAWVTISLEYNLREILIGILDCTRELNDDMHRMKEYQLAEYLYKSLKNRRYLIVLDDMWSTKVWDELKMSFPDDYNGSRIIVTTRELNVANYADSLCFHHQMHLLNEDESWNLLRSKVFTQEDCPVEFENLGKHIARSCAGLPLAISVVAGILSTDKSTIDLWEHIASDVSSTATRSDDHFSKILSLSYNHLPHHLKPCFLYMGAFPEDCEIRASKLIRLWVAEGFLKSIEDQSLEEAGEVYLKALVDRNLILVCQKEINGKVTTYKIHDLLKDLCMRKASEEKNIIVLSGRLDSDFEGNKSLVRLNAHSSFDIDRHSIDLMPLARSFVCFSFAVWASKEKLSFVLNVRLLRVLDILRIPFSKLPEEILQLVNLRYLAFKCRWGLSSSISRLWNLQTLIFCQNFTNSKQAMIAGNGNIPFEIWNMLHLRHLKFKETSIWIEQNFGENLVQENLQTLSTIRLLGSRNNKFLERFPNLKKLGITCDAIKVDFGFLHKLETLKCSSDLMPGARVCRSNFTFPPSLKKLTLSGFVLTWKIMTIVGSLLNLEVLKLQYCNFHSPTEQEWEPTEGEFCQLVFLLLEKLNLVKWHANYSHFPVLRCLVIRECSALEEIPASIGEISTLELIEVDKSSLSVVASARKIQEEQLDFGNDDLQVHIYGVQ